jgi:chemotaxis protein methyltransferase CheR
MPMSRDRVFECELTELLDTIYRQYHQDFRDYSPGSLQRRIRHAVRRLGCRSVGELQRKLLQTPPLFGWLLQYLTVPVSELFRDPDYFAALREQVVPLLRTYTSRRIWVAGCSYGEEVYSLAILLHEEGLLDRTILYATDINPAALESARRGIFSLENMRCYTENYQRAGGKAAFSDYYTTGYGGAIFRRDLLRNVVFADHSLATDSVFSETQFVSCRNVLIYFNRELKDRALGLFRESLCHRGFLGLGSRESVAFSAHSEAFEPVAKAEKIFQKRSQCG